VKILREAASSIVVGSLELAKRSGTGASDRQIRMLWSRMYKLKEENAALGRELAGRGVSSSQECRRDDPLTSVSGRFPHDRGRVSLPWRPW
jgi:hypothetical protein